MTIPVFKCSIATTTCHCDFALPWGIIIFAIILHLLLTFFLRLIVERIHRFHDVFPSRSGAPESHHVSTISVFLIKSGASGTRRASTIPLSVTKNDGPGSRHASTIAIFRHKKRNLPSATRTLQFAYALPARTRHGSGPRSQLS